MSTLVVTTSRLNMRSCPSIGCPPTGCPPIAVLNFATRHELAASQGDWRLLKHGAGYGWCFGQYLADPSKAGLCIGFVLAEEGGLSLDRDDLGNWTGGRVGEGRFVGTKYGISAYAYPHLDILRLDLSTAMEIYQRDWYNDMGLDEVPYPMALYRLDTAVNCGRAGEAVIRQRFGDSADPTFYLEIRREYYRSLRSFERYGESWLGRVARIRQFAEALKPDGDPWPV